MSNKEVALQIIHFLKTAVKNKEVSDDYVDSIDVAIDCVADAFEVNKDDDASIVTKYNNKGLSEILDQFKAGTNDVSPAETEVPVHVDENEVDEETVKKADALKLEGNKAMAKKEFQEAVAKYSAAIKLLPTNAVYLSNRAAAYSSLLKHEEAIQDAKAAIKANPTYSKAYSRLGLASYALNKPKDALDAYKKGLEIEGENPSETMKKGYETAKKRVQEQLDLSVPESNSSESDSRDTGVGAGAAAGAGSFPDFSNLASMLGGAGGSPNFSEMLNNPALMQYAEQMMQNPAALQNLFSNPAVQQMAQQFGLGGGAGGSPDLSNLMNNPAIQNLANSFMGGENGANSNSGNHNNNNSN